MLRVAAASTEQLTHTLHDLLRAPVRVAALMDLGKQMLGRRQVMDGVPEMIHDVQVEGTFPDGSKLATVHQPIVRDDGDLALALYGSFLPVPELAKFGELAPDAQAPGAITAGAGTLELNTGRRTRSTATSASSAAARSCVIAWARPPGSRPPTRSTS